MQNMKRFAALALAATMVLGSSLTAFADGETSDASTGAGTLEGHVEKKATNVVIPTEVANTTFAYTMDPERLIVETSHGKYGDAVVFPASGDTGVYFNNGPKGGDGADKDNVVYANTSKALDVVNKSSHSIDLTVEAEAVAGANDIPLVAQSDIAGAEAASLYLGLKVGSAAAETVLADTAATKTVSIAGTEGNFKTAVKTVEGVKSYEYRALTLDEYKALEGNSTKTQADYDATWAKTSFNLEGAVTEDLQITSSTTAPSVKVTWSWVDTSVEAEEPEEPEDPEDPEEPEVPADAAPSIATTSYGYTSGSALEIPVSLGSGDLAATGINRITYTNSSGVSTALTNDKWSFGDGKITIAESYITALAGSSVTRDFKITFNDTAGTQVVINLHP